MENVSVFDTPLKVDKCLTQGQTMADKFTTVGIGNSLTNGRDVDA